MTSKPTAHAETPSRLRRIVFVAVAASVAVLFSSACLNLLAPWTGVNLDNTIDPTTHRWHHALEGAVDALTVGVIVALALRPLRRPLLAQFVAACALLAGAVVIPFVGPMFLIIVGALLLVPATYPKPAVLLRPWRWSRAGTSLPLVTVALVTAAALLTRAGQAVTWQLAGHLGEHATSTAWATDAEHLVLLAVAGLAAATRGSGWRILAVGCTVVYVYLGTVAIMLPDQPGSWGRAGGVAAYLAAALFIVTMRLATTHIPAHEGESLAQARIGT